MTIGYIRQVRAQQDAAQQKAKDDNTKFTPIFWYGDYTKPQMMAMILGGNKK